MSYNILLVTKRYTCILLSTACTYGWCTACRSITSWWLAVPAVSVQLDLSCWIWTLVHTRFLALCTYRTQCSLEQINSSRQWNYINTPHGAKESLSSPSCTCVCSVLVVTVMCYSQIVYRWVPQILMATWCSPQEGWWNASKTENQLTAETAGTCGQKSVNIIEIYSLENCCNTLKLWKSQDDAIVPLVWKYVTARYISIHYYWSFISGRKLSYSQIETQRYCVIQSKWYPACNKKVWRLLAHLLSKLL